jgi:hypothetical protein
MYALFNAMTLAVGAQYVQTGQMFAPPQPQYRDNGTTPDENVSQTTVDGAGNGLVKEGLGKISGNTYKVTQSDINTIKRHLSGFDPSYANKEMINRLETALKNGTSITGADASFYLHELKESGLMRSGMSYAQAHQAALNFYGVSNFSVYHPDVIKIDPSYWNQGWFDFWGITK